jgi:hypothetical protein
MTFPEQVHYSRADGSGWTIKDWDTANKLLSYVSLKDNPFVTFTLPDNSYIQCLGSKVALTIECREIRAGGAFRHVVFGKSALAGTTTKVGPESAPVPVDPSQVLAMRDARCEDTDPSISRNPHVFRATPLQMSRPTSCSQRVAPNTSVERDRPQAGLVGSLRGFAATAAPHVKH